MADCLSFSPSPVRAERGNVLFMILIAVALIGFLTAAVMSSGQNESAAIDEETLAVRASEVQRQAGEIERAVLFIVNNGRSESDLRFAHPDAPSDYGDLGADADKSDQIFHRDGGGTNYPSAPDDVNDGSPWEFYGGTALPAVGSDRAELVAVLPNVTQAFCDKINALNGQPTGASTPQDTGGSLASGASAGNCVNMGDDGRFGDTRQFYASPNTADAATFAQNPEISAARPALEGCALCSADSKYHYFHTLLAR